MIHNTKYKLVIGWLYPELMSTYGARGNIIVLQKRCAWRGISVEIKRLDVDFDHKLLDVCDLLFMGGAQDMQQKIVAEDLMKKQEKLKQMIEDGIPGLYICGAYQFLGKYYKEADGTIIPGLDILDLYTENSGANHPRLIGNIVASLTDLRGRKHETSEVDAQTIVGFENHGGRTYLGKNVKPLGKVIKGFGNNGGDQTEGAVYKNSYGTYLHGPFLPKNPFFADYLIKLALEKKCGVSPTCPPKPWRRRISLPPLDDSLETKAHDAIAKKLNIKL
jgi:hypothetical protein